MATAVLRSVDYSDCVKNIREYAARLDELAQGEIVGGDELRHVVSCLEETARSLEARQIGPAPHRPSSAPDAGVLQPAI